MNTLSKFAFVLAFALALSAAAQDVVMPPAQDDAEAALENSPRHGEFVYIDVPGTDTKLYTWIVFPERPDKAPVVLVIHEIFGMTDWVNSVADNLAANGFIAVAPDMISGVEGDDNNMTKVRALPDEEIVKRLNAARDYALELPAANGKTGSIGFCWGGSASFIYATAQPDLDAAVICYGSSPDAEALANVQAPLLGLYAENDARVNTTIDPAKEELDKLGKPFEYEIYSGAGHGFFRAQAGSRGANGEATKQGWERAVTFFRQHLETE